MLTVKHCFLSVSWLERGASSKRRKTSLRGNETWRKLRFIKRCKESGFSRWLPGHCFPSLQDNTCLHFILKPPVVETPTTSILYHCNWPFLSTAHNLLESEQYNILGPVTFICYWKRSCFKKITHSAGGNQTISVIRWAQFQFTILAWLSSPSFQFAESQRVHSSFRGLSTVDIALAKCYE